MSVLRLQGDSSFPPSLHTVIAHFDEQSAPRRRRVLVVDDERLIADTVVQILNIHGYDAFGAYSAAEALKLAENFMPDYLLSDVMMPGTNGIDLAVAVQEMLPAVLVLLFSGQAGTSQLIENRNLPFALEAKPIHPEKLIKTLEKLGRRR